MQIGKVCSFPAVECRKICWLNLDETVPGKEKSEPLPGWRPRCLNDKRVQVGRGTRRLIRYFLALIPTSKLTVSPGAARIANLR
jgi:hypothetical protein